MNSTIRVGAGTDAAATSSETDPRWAAVRTRDADAEQAGFRPCRCCKPNAHSLACRGAGTVPQHRPW